ncbi:MAG: DMT family transporter [Clostridiaceae bacterium]|nr:DMT family transporter [Clostridiaceae bacterium]
MNSFKNKSEQWAILAMTIAAAIWGSGFIVTRIALDAGFTTAQILFYRFALAAVFFGLVFYRHIRRITKRDLAAGLPAGLLLFFGFMTQTIGLRQTSPARNAFITATYVVIVPFLGWLITRRKPGLKIFGGACCSLLGIGILSFDGSSGALLTVGDGLTLICALCFAAHFLVLEWAVRKIDTQILLFLQMAVTTVCSLIILPFDGGFRLVQGAAAGDWKAGAAAVLYLALFSSGLAYFIQTSAQKYTTSSKAAIVLAAEALWGSLFSLLFGFEPLTPRLVVGGLLIFASILIVEWPAKKTSLSGSVDPTGLDRERADNAAAAAQLQFTPAPAEPACQTEQKAEDSGSPEIIR